MTQKILLTLEIDDAALDTAQAKADKLIATLKEAEALACALENAVAIDCDDFADRLAAAKTLAQEKPPEGGKDFVSPDSYREHPHAWDATPYAEAQRQFAQKFAQRMFQPPD